MTPGKHGGVDMGWHDRTGVLQAHLAVCIATNGLAISTVPNPAQALLVAKTGTAIGDVCKSEKARLSWPRANWLPPFSRARAIDFYSPHKNTPPSNTWSRESCAAR